jgi:TonB-dependent starch-binding outer membrane protein SusC
MNLILNLILNLTLNVTVNLTFHTLKLQRNLFFAAFSCAVLLVFPFTDIEAYAQTTATSPKNAVITGTVSNGARTETLSGVVVKVMNVMNVTKNASASANASGSANAGGAVTNSSGRFRIEVPAGSYTLVARALGYKPLTKTITLEAAQTLDEALALEDDPIRSEEIVVSGQGVGLERRRVSTVTTVVTGKQLERSIAPRFEQVLQSQIPNAQFSLRSGQAGGTSTLRSRGLSSVTLGSTPIIYVDGVRLDNLNSPTTLTANVSSFTTYPTQQSTQTSALADIPMDNIERVEFITGGAATTLYGSDAANGVLQIFTKTGYELATSTPRINAEVRLGFDAPTTQFLRFARTPDLLYRNGFTQQYAVNASGGGELMGYSVAATAQLADGFRVNNAQSEQYSIRLGLNAQLAPTLRYTSSFGLAANSYRRAKDGNAGNYTPLWVVEDGLAVAYGFPADVDAMPDTSYAQFKNFIRRAEDLLSNRVAVTRFQTSQALELQPAPNLRVRLLGGLDFRSSNERVVTTNEFLQHTRVIAPTVNNRGTIDEVSRTFVGLTFEATAQHRAELETSIGAVSLVSNVGGQFFRTNDDQIRIFGDNVRDGSLIVAGAGVQTSNQFRLQVANYGLYALENIGVLNRYFLEIGVRADGNTAFGREVGLQVFPKVGVSYVLSDEPFFAPLKSAIQSLILRANYGVAGNFPPPFRRDRTIAFNSYLGQPAASFGQAENPQIRPERTATTEIGAEASLLEAEGLPLTLGATWYSAITSDALFTVPLATSLPDQSILKNVGQIANRGIELRMNATLLKTAETLVQANASLNTTHNEVLNSGGTQPFAIGGYSAATVQNVVAEGAPIGYLRGARAVLGANNTYSVENFQANLGSTIPTMFGSVGLNATLWKRLDISLSADYQYGAYAHSFDQQFRFLLGISDGRVPSAVVQNAGKPVNQIWTDFTNFFVERTDFWRLRFVSVSYSLPEAWFEALPGVQQVTVGISATNLLTWTQASFDPETANAAALTQGGVSVTGTSYAIDSAPRTFLASLRVRF